MKIAFKFDFDEAATRAKLGELSNKITNKLGNDALKNLQAANPVDTGYSRGRWVYIPPKVPFGVGIITNDATYILILNDGWSKQAAEGWIEAAFQAAVRFLR